MAINLNMSALESEAHRHIGKLTESSPVQIANTTSPAPESLEKSRKPAPVQSRINDIPHKIGQTPSMLRPGDYAKAALNPAENLENKNHNALHPLPKNSQLIGNFIIRDLLIGPITDLLVIRNGDKMAMAETFTAHTLWTAQDGSNLINRFRDIRNGYYKEPKSTTEVSGNKVPQKNIVEKIRETLGSSMTLNAVLGIIPLAAFDGLYFALPDKG